MSHSTLEARASFAVCCDGHSFRQYLEDAQKLVFSLHISQDKVRPFQMEEVANITTGSSSKNILQPASSNVFGLSSGLPEHIIGTPRHRLLEKKRVQWSPGEEIGHATVLGLGLNVRGELVQECVVKNTFGDMCGSLNVTLLFHDTSTRKELSQVSPQYCSEASDSIFMSKFANKENIPHSENVTHKEDATFGKTNYSSCFLRDNKNSSSSSSLHKQVYGSNGRRSHLAPVTLATTAPPPTTTAPPPTTTAPPLTATAPPFTSTTPPLTSTAPPSTTMHHHLPSIATAPPATYQYLPVRVYAYYIV